MKVAMEECNVHTSKVENTARQNYEGVESKLAVFQTQLDIFKSSQDDLPS